MTFEAVPSLVIGLGGTGLKSVTLLKRNLLQLNRNTLPEQVRLCVIDTEDDIKFAAGGSGRLRLEGDSMRQTEPVSIDKYGEYAGITGDISELGSTIAMEQDDGNNNPAIRRNQAHRHINAWFQAKYYINEANMPANVWGLTVGAGQYRQMGRLGLFSKLQKVTQLLGGSIDGMRAQGARRVNVHIVGSLAGGTGSALFADCAHLVKMIADAKLGPNAATVFGHFVMAEAFLGTPEVNFSDERKLRQFNARSFAMLRELIRLQGATREISYQVTYDPSGTGWMNSRIDRLLFDAAWLYDGKRTRNPLEKVEIQSGVAPTIAEAIMAFLDAQSSGAMVSHLYAVHSKRLYGAGNLPPKQVTFSSLGVYSIELPIHHIVEGWSHGLARETLDALLGPIDREEKTKLPLKFPDQLAQDRSPEQRIVEPPPDRAKRFLTEQTTLLVNRLADYGRQAARTPELRRQKVNEVVALDAETWKQLLAPGHPAFQDLVSQAHDDLVGSLKVDGSYLVDYGKFGGSAEQKAVNLQAAADEALGRMLGEIEDVWRRTGGNVGISLEKLAVLHQREYTASLQKWMSEHLNGTSSSGDALEKKHGKLGYVTAVLQSLADVFKEAQSVVQDADEAARTQRRPVFDGLDVERRQAFGRMRDSSGFMNLHLRNYRDKSDELAQFQKADIARRLVVRLVKALQTRTEEALAEAQRWAKILATGRVSEGGHTR